MPQLWSRFRDFDPQLSATWAMTGRCASNWWMPTRWMLITFAAPLLTASVNARPQAQAAPGPVAAREGASTTATGISLYQAAGFCVAGRRRNYYTAPVEDALRMTCDLERKTQFPLGG